MGWCTTPDLDQFMTAAGGYLVSRTAENSLLLSAAQAARFGWPLDAADGQPGSGQPNGSQPGAAPLGADPWGGLLFGWWEPPDGGDPRGAFLHHPAVPLLVSGRVPEMAAALAAVLAKTGRPVFGVDAPTEAADAFAAAWSHRAGTVVRVHRNCRVYRLTRANAAPGGGQAPGAWPAPGMPGSAGRLRVATAADQPLLAGWLTAFATETGERGGSPADQAADLISYGGAVWWEVPLRSGRPVGAAHFRPVGRHRDTAPAEEAGYQPVALAALTRPVAGTVRISLLFTPAERRRSGYASAVTLAVSRAVLSGGTLGDALGGPRGLLGGAAAGGRVTEMVMIADKGRQERWGGRLGYQLVSERVVLRFGPVTGPMPRLASTGPAPRLPTGPLPRLPR